MSLVYYNEIDPKAASWLRELISEGHIPDGHVDTRDIRDVPPSDVAGYTQCHFFAGIGGWAYALRLADWPRSRPVWTGSCPCQPFSSAGKGAGLADDRHLWPAFRWLIAQCQPATVFGEQVAPKAGREWLAGVRLDLEAMGYAVGGADLCAAGVGAPHIRQRLFWVADGEPAVLQGHCRHERDGDKFGRHGAEQTGSVAKGCTVDWSRTIWWPCRDGKLRRVPARRLGNGISNRRGALRDGNHARHVRPITDATCETGRLSDGANDNRRGGEWSQKTGIGENGVRRRGSTSDNRGFPPSQHDRLEVEPALFPLADGIPGRVGLLRGAGNAIVPEVAAQFIAAFREVQQQRRASR